MPESVVPWVNLGKSGLKISNVIIGCATYGSKEQPGSWVLDDEEEVFAILNRAYELGIRTFDTADVYSNGASERMLGSWIKKCKIKRDKIVVMSKVYRAIDEGMKDIKERKERGFTKADQIELINCKGLSRKHILDGVQSSVERLGTYLDVLQIHRFDHEVPMEETMRALNDVVEQGYTRYIGASSMRAVEFVMLQNVAEKNGWHKFINMQGFYNLLNREDENEMNYYCQQTGVGITPWSPLSRGLLARPVPDEIDQFTLTPRQAAGGLTFTRNDESKSIQTTIITRVQEVAEKKGVPMAAVATSWVISKGANPIVGVNSVKRVEELVIGANMILSEEEIAYLEEPYTPQKRAIFK